MGLPYRWKEAIRILAVINREEVMGDSRSVLTEMERKVGEE